jgi:hypothetical protein
MSEVTNRPRNLFTCIRCEEVSLQWWNSDASLLWACNVEPCNTISHVTSRHVIAECVLRLPLSVNHYVEPTQSTLSVQDVYIYFPIIQTHGTHCDIYILKQTCSTCSSRAVCCPRQRATDRHPSPRWVWTHNLSRRAAADLRLRPHGYRDRHWSV